MIYLNHIKWNKDPNFSIGEIKNAAGIRKKAYLFAKNKTEKIFLKLKKINPEIIHRIAEKTFFELNFKQKHDALVNRRFANENKKKLNFKKRKNPFFIQNNYFSVLLQITKSLIYIILICLKSKPKNKVNNKIICRVDCEQTFSMWKKLFPRKKICLFVKDPKEFCPQKTKILMGSLSMYGLSLGQKKMLFYLFFCTLKFFFTKKIWKIGLQNYFFSLIRNFTQGLMATPICGNSFFFTFEHGSSPYAFRNCLLKSQNSYSIFVPYNSYAIDHYFPDEYKMNYSIVGSSGKLFEKSYKNQQSEGKILALGPFAPNFSGYKKIKTRKKTLCFLFTGYSPFTKIPEIKLATLVKKIIKKIKHVKIVCRLKPVKLTHQSIKFYTEIFSKNKNIYLEHKTKNLFSYIKNTDLFVCANSSSAVDLLCAGGNIIAGNFQNDKDLYYWQTQINGIFLKSKLLEEAVIKYFNKSKYRKKLTKKNNKLRNLFYLFNSPKTYLKNFRYKIKKSLHYKIDK